MLVVPQIRLATPQDANCIAEMSRDQIEQGLEWSWQQPRVLRAIRDRSTNVAVVTEARSIAGFGIMQYDLETAHLALFAVRSLRQNRGLGSFLLSWLEKPAAIAGIVRLRLEARVDNRRAIAFYEKRGFVEWARVAGYYQGTVDAVRLEKRL